MKTAPETIYSRQGEQGFISSMLEAMAVSAGFYVDLGASNGIEGSNTRFLAVRDWYGVAIEADKALYQQLLTNMKQFPRVRTVNQRINCEKDNSLEELLTSLKTPHAFDVLSIDTCGNDYWMWKSLTYEPKIVVIEYNPNYKNTESKVMPYSADHTWAGDSHYGASAKAMCDLAAKKGYVLVYCLSPANLIFVKERYAGLFPQRAILAEIPKVELFKASGMWMITPQ